MLEIETKVCSKCGIELSINKFGKQKTSKDGLMSWCKKCFKEYNKKYREENIEKEHERSKKYREENKDKILKANKKFKDENPNSGKESSRKYAKENPEKRKEIQKKYGKKNKDKINKYCKKYRGDNVEKEKKRQKKWREENIVKAVEHEKKYREENVDKIKKGQKKWKSENKDKTNIYTQRRRARKLLLPSTFTIKQWEDVKIYFNNKCCYCGEKVPLTMEHFIPIDNGGGYVKSNIICACGSCNYSKNDKEFTSWYKIYKYYSKEREDFILEYLNSVKEIQMPLTLAI